MKKVKSCCDTCQHGPRDFDNLPCKECIWWSKYKQKQEFIERNLNYRRNYDNV